MPITHATTTAASDNPAYDVSANEWNAAHAGTPFGQTYSYPTTFTGDTINGSSTTPFVDVTAFDTKEVLNSRILHLRTLGASKDQRVRVTLGTTKAAAYDVTTCVALGGVYWSAAFDTYLEIRGSTSADAQLFIARIGPFVAATYGYGHQLRMGGSSAVSTNANLSAPLGTTFTVRFIRDGSNVITFFAGMGTAPLALIPMLTQSADAVYTETISGTLARIEYSIHTPSGPGSTAQWDAYVDWLASI